MDFYVSAAQVSPGIPMGSGADTVILCRVAMDSPHESLSLIEQCIREIYHLRPGETYDARQQKHKPLCIEDGVQSGLSWCIRTAANSASPPLIADA